MSALATMPTVAAEDGIEAEHHNNVAANIRTISRNFWDAGTPDLPLSEQKQGTSWMDPTTLAMWIFRIAGEDDPRDAGSPLRPTWHWNDFEGPPPADGRVAEGDCLIWDSGSGDTYVLYRDAGRFRGLGVLVEYRTAATATNGTTQNQSSDRITMRSSRWDTSGTPAAQDREWSMYCHTSASAGDGYSLLHIDRRHNGGSWTGVATLDTNGWLYLAGGVPGVELNSGGAGSAFLRLYSGDPDGSLLKFGHGNGSRWGRFRAYGTTTGGTGLAADVLGVSYGSAATGGATLKNSPSFAHYASAWDGVDTAVELGSYEQLIPTSSTAAYLRRGFGSFGPGTLDLHHYGRLALAGTTTLSGALGDGDAAQVTLTPTYDGAHTVTRHSYRKLANPTLTNSAVVTDACRDHYDAAAGTHKALDAAAGGAGAWEKVNANGTVMYGPVYSGKDLKTPATAYGEIYLSTGTVNQDLAVSGTPQRVTGFDADGVGVGCTPTSVNDKITVGVTGTYWVTAQCSISGDAAGYFVGVVQEASGTPTGPGPGMSASLAASEVKAVIAQGYMTLTAGNDLTVYMASDGPDHTSVDVGDLGLTLMRVA